MSKILTGLIDGFRSDVSDWRMRAKASLGVAQHVAYGILGATFFHALEEEHTLSDEAKIWIIVAGIALLVIVWLTPEGAPLAGDDDDGE